MTDSNTQLTSASGYNTDRMVFSEPQKGSIPNTIPAINFQRILISTKNPDGTQGELILPTSRLFSFGVSENKNPETGKVNGYVLPLCLHNRDGATKEERAWSETFDNIVDKCKEFLVDNRDDIEQYELELTDLRKFNPLYYKKERGKIVEGTGPTLYSKLIVSKKHNKIVTMFFDKNNKPIDALDLLGKYCYVRGAVKIESIFIGNKISLQVKLYEAEAEMVQTGMRSLLSRPTANPRVLKCGGSTVNPLEDDDELTVESLTLEDPGDESLDDDVDSKQTVTKKKVRRIKKVKKSSA